MIAIGSVPVVWNCIKKNEATQTVNNRGDDLTNTPPTNLIIIRNASPVGISAVHNQVSLNPENRTLEIVDRMVLLGKIITPLR